MEVLREAPRTGSFVPLAEHQSTTPASFHSGPPILHYCSDRCKVIVLEDELQYAPALSEFTAKLSQAHSNEQDQSEETNGDSAQKVMEDIDVWVTSETLLLFSNSHDIGLSIPYPTIALHAIQSTPTPSSVEPRSQGLYMQFIPSIPSDEDEPPDTVSVIIIPTASAPPPSTASTANEDDAIDSEDKPEQTPAQAFFTALSDCSNLHPDPIDDDEEEGGSRLMQSGLAIPGNSDGSLPPPMPGSGGWITAENMHEFIDADGNFIMDDEEMEETGENEQLGPGAGTVRSHPEDDGKDDSIDDTKWQRTS